MKALYVLSISVLLAGCSTAPAPAPVAESHGVGRIVRLDPAFDFLTIMAMPVKHPDSREPYR